MDNKAYVVTPKVCPLTPTEQCVYDTQGHVSCQGRLTEGLKETQAVAKTVADKNEQLFQRLLDERITWR